MLNTLQKPKPAVKLIKKIPTLQYFEAKNILIYKDDILTTSSIPEKFY